MVREIIEAGVVLGLAVGGVALAIYDQGVPLPRIKPPIEAPVAPVPAPPPPPPPPVEESKSEDGEMPLQAAPRDPQLIVVPPPRAEQALDKIEDKLLRIQERIDRIEKKADEK